MFVYRCVAEHLNHPELGNYDTFGIVADEVIEGKTMGRVLAAAGCDRGCADLRKKREYITRPLHEFCAVVFLLFKCFCLHRKS